MGKLITRFKVFMFDYFLFEYAFQPWKYAYVELLERTTEVDQVLKQQHLADKIYYFEAEVDGRPVHSQAFKSIWDEARPGDVIAIKYRYSIIENDVPGGRAIESYVPVNLPTKEQLNQA